MAGKRGKKGAAKIDNVEEEDVATPTKKVRMDAIVEQKVAARGVVTPAGPPKKNDSVDRIDARRSLFPGHAAAVTPARLVIDEEKTPSPTKRKLIFGRLVNEITVQDNVRTVYGIVRKLTGSIGGNGSHGPIYGELTMGSMQKMINLMKEHTGLDQTSRFIDVGSGIGKPNLHVAQDPGVEFSYGIEVEPDRWLLGMNCLKAVLDAAVEQDTETEEEARIGHRCMFEAGDIRAAKTFDPFTHVYMFSIGFPPELWIELAEKWNKSSSGYLICYHGPKDIIGHYEFNVELLTKTPTSMHGSKEGHQGYIYRRAPASKIRANASCDPVFTRAYGQVKGSLVSLRDSAESILESKMKSGPSTRARRLA